MIQIREEQPGDLDAIAEVNRRAFGGDEEVRLVRRLRDAGLVIVSLVAVEEDAVIGHILFSEIQVGPHRAAALAPMAVLPGRQRTGIGSALVRRGLDACRERGYSIAVVVGHPEYYPRFGFSPEKARHLHSPYAGPAFMALELTPGSLETVRGEVVYPGAFHEL